jgi:hypothetical protein
MMMMMMMMIGSSSLAKALGKLSSKARKALIIEWLVNVIA